MNTHSKIGLKAHKQTDTQHQTWFFFNQVLVAESFGFVVFLKPTHFAPSIKGGAKPMGILEELPTQ